MVTTIVGGRWRWSFFVWQKLVAAYSTELEFHKKLMTPAEQVLYEYTYVSSNDLGTVQGLEAPFEIKPNAVPRFHKPRPEP